jgi:hypothetical protein
MKRIIGLTAGVLLLLVPRSAFCQAAAQRPRYEVRRAVAPITIDGHINESEWSQASPAVEFIFPWNQQTGAKQKTHARLLWDDTNLYVAYEVEDTDIVAQFTDRDAWVYRDDTVELFLNVRPAQLAGYYGIELNVRGAMMDYICAWTADVQSYIRRFQMEGIKTGIQIDGTLNKPDDKDRGWTVEMAIPWDNFSDMAKVPPQAGTVFTANLNRWDGVEPNRRLSVWADSKLSWPHPHAPAQFGDLVFVR